MARKSKGGLGKGLNALIADATIESGSGGGQEELPIEEIEPNPNQPRKDFNEQGLADLADSIKREGLLQPILVRPIGKGYQIVAGERRWQACKLAGLEKVPVRIVEMDDERTLRVALIENLQRSDLNPLEEAQGYRDLMKAGNLTQAQVAEAVSKSRSAIANTLRLLDLPDAVQKMVYEGSISAGHARAILSIPEEDKRIQLAQRIEEKQLTVREAESMARLMAANTEERAKRVPQPRSYKVVAKELKKKFNSPVKIKSARGKNKIEIEFKDEADLQRIYELIDGSSRESEL